MPSWFKKKKKQEIVFIPPPPKTFRYYRSPLFDNQPHGPGLAIEQLANSNFAELTIDTLDAIYSTPTGKIVIDGLVQSGRQVKITKASLGNSCDVGPNGLNSVAREVHKGDIGQATKAALERTAQMAALGMPKYDWLANQINTTPLYKLKGVPAANANNIGATGAKVSAWFDSGQLNTADLLHRQHAMNSIIIALSPHAADGPGSDAAIGFNEDPTFILNLERPAGIGLAHELIHAYWSSRGQQQGWTIEHPTTVLFEYKCVGLGPWAHTHAAHGICENQIRQEWFGNTARLFKRNDFVNRAAPDRRNYYSKAANQ